LNLTLDVLNRIRCLRVQSDRLTRESFNEDLHCIRWYIQKRLDHLLKKLNDMSVIRIGIKMSVNTLMNGQWKNYMPDVEKRLVTLEANQNKLSVYESRLAALETVHKKIYFHGRDNEHLFWVYPSQLQLNNKWDTHLVAEKYCKNNKYIQNPNGTLHEYKCLGHTSKDDFKEAEEEWVREKVQSPADGIQIGFQSNEKDFHDIHKSIQIGFQSNENDFHNIHKSITALEKAQRVEDLQNVNGDDIQELKKRIESLESILKPNQGMVTPNSIGMIILIILLALIIQFRYTFTPKSMTKDMIVSSSDLV
jgi:hypothetical protein